MRVGVGKALRAVGGLPSGRMQGHLTSDKPLLNSNDASFPLPSGAEVAGQSLKMTISE
jgi:hypothetical protein